jgi:hypothetical protein
MLLDRLDKYISEVEKHDKVWTGIITSGIELNEVMKMSEEKRNEILHLLDDKMINKIKKLEEGGLI